MRPHTVPHLGLLSAQFMAFKLEPAASFLPQQLPFVAQWIHYIIIYYTPGLLQVVMLLLLHAGWWSDFLGSKYFLKVEQKVEVCII